ncbi:MAG: hypothetical protein QNJ41_17325 [Xenococcaceae cyanobacterium MO_188.B32]|nr:hypothetical protein [Xenococcaceae cyanobacterium MO_188.B32]
MSENEELLTLLNSRFDKVIEDMGASPKRALDTYLQRSIEQIFKLRYWY